MAIQSNNSQAPRSGTGFVNLKKYLDANKGNQLGQAVGNNISNVAQQAKGGLGGVKEQFQQDVSKSLLGEEDANKRDTAITGALSGEAPTVGDDQAKQFETFRAGQYAGPQDIGSSKFAKTFGEASGKAQEAEKLGANTRTAGGREELLRTFVKAPQYTSGERRLDNMLLGSNANQLGQVRKATQGLVGQAQGVQQQTKGIADLGRLQNQQFGEQTRAKLGLDEAGNIKLDDTAGAFGQVYNPLKQKLESAPDFHKQAAETLAKLKSKDTRGNVLSQLGVPSQSLYGVDPSQYLRDTSQDVRLENVAGGADYNKLNALAKLAGQQQNILTDPSKATPLEQLKAYDFDKGALGQNIAQEKSNYQGQFNPQVQSLIDSLGVTNNGNFGFLRDPRQVNAAVAQLNDLNKKYEQAGLQAPRMAESLDEMKAQGLNFEGRANQYANLQNYLKQVLGQQGTPVDSKINDFLAGGGGIIKK